MNNLTYNIQSAFFCVHSLFAIREKYHDTFWIPLTREITRRSVVSIKSLARRSDVYSYMMRLTSLRVDAVFQARWDDDACYQALTSISLVQDVKRSVVCSFAVYQRSCDWSDILVLEDSHDEHYTTRYPLTDIESIFWVTFSEPAYSSVLDKAMSGEQYQSPFDYTVGMYVYIILWLDLGWNRVEEF